MIVSHISITWQVTDMLSFDGVGNADVSKPTERGRKNHSADHGGYQSMVSSWPERLGCEAEGMGWELRRQMDMKIPGRKTGERRPLPLRGKDHSYNRQASRGFQKSLAWPLRSSVQFSHSVMSNSLRPHGPQHTRLPCSSPTPGVYSNSCPSSWWCHPTISSSVILFSHLQSFPASGSFPMSQFPWPKYWSFSFSIRVVESLAITQDSHKFLTGYDPNWAVHIYQVEESPSWTQSYPAWLSAVREHVLVPEDHFLWKNTWNFLWKRVKRKLKCSPHTCMLRRVLLHHTKHPHGSTPFLCLLPSPLEARPGRGLSSARVGVWPPFFGQLAPCSPQQAR